MLSDYPRLTAHNKKGDLVAVSSNMSKFPAYQNTRVIDSAETMKDLVCPAGGYVMQQDDGWSPAFVLYHS